MKHTITLITALLLPPLTALNAADSSSLQPPRHVGKPKPEHAVTNRAFQGIPSMAVAPGGRLWANWYAGVTPGEDHNNYVVLSTSGNGGATWKEVLIIDPDGGGVARAFDPELWVSPDGRLFVFWAQMERGRRDTRLGVWCMETRQADAEQPEWSRPRRITDGVMMCKPLTLATGEWVLPVSKWAAHDNSAQMIVSTDKGELWTLRGGCNVPVEARNADEHMFIERRDGSIWLLVRTKYGIGESISTDRGMTWPELKPAAIRHATARFFISRLASGNLLLVKHGPLDLRTSRSHLTAYISTDDGGTWSGGLMLDERLGVSYPDGQQTPDGLIRIIYDYHRTSDRNILMATFREEDALAGKDVSGEVKLRQIVSKASGGREKAVTKSKEPVNDNANGKPLRTKNPGTLASEGIKPQSFAPGAKLFSDRGYIAAEVPDALQAAHFLPIPMDDRKTLTCQRAGVVYFLTPQPERNRDTQSQPLMDQGFEKVALPEVRLFGGSPKNFCTLYQKDCAVGETILIGKWALPLFIP